ncbi:hypothetical protein BD560DRAFT_492565 [Blakeslea trispora]|nr:hypothetical protein BD560DRAFT_492565 [Blakeslea trispora]
MEGEDYEKKAFCLVKRKSVKHDKKLFLRQSEKVYGGSDAAQLEAEMDRHSWKQRWKQKQGPSKASVKAGLELFSNRVTSNNKARQERQERRGTSMSVPASSAQIPTGHAHSVNRSGGIIALSHSDFSPNTRKRGSFAKMD